MASSSYKIVCLQPGYRSKRFTGPRPWNPGRYDVVEIATNIGLAEPCESLGEAQAMKRLLEGANQTPEHDNG